MLISVNLSSRLHVCTLSRIILQRPPLFPATLWVFPYLTDRLSFFLPSFSSLLFPSFFCIASFFLCWLWFGTSLKETSAEEKKGKHRHLIFEYESAELWHREIIYIEEIHVLNPSYCVIGSANSVKFKNLLLCHVWPIFRPNQTLLMVLAVNLQRSSKLL